MTDKAAAVSAQPRDNKGRWVENPRASAADVDVDLSGAEDADASDSDDVRKGAARRMGSAVLRGSKLATRPLVWTGATAVGVVLGFRDAFRSPSKLELDERKTRMRQLAQWRLEAFRVPVRYTDDESVDAAWSRLLDVCEENDASLRVDGLIEEHYTAPHLAPFRDSSLVDISDLGWEGATVTDNRSVVLAEDMDKPRRVVVLAHEAAHLIDPHIQSKQWKKNPGVRADSEIVAELAAHLFSDWYGVTTTQRSWRYVEGWVNKALADGTRTSLKQLRRKDDIVPRVCEVLRQLFPDDDRPSDAEIEKRVFDTFHKFSAQPTFGHDPTRR